MNAEWERCKGWLEPACEDGWTIDAVEAEIREQRATFWPMANSAAVTQVMDYPKGKVLRVWLAGGDLNELTHFLPAGENYARMNGCIGVEMEARPGWERVLKGYRKHAVVLVKELCNG